MLIIKNSLGEKVIKLEDDGSMKVIGAIITKETKDSSGE